MLWRQSHGHSIPQGPAVDCRGAAAPSALKRATPRESRDPAAAAAEPAAAQTGSDPPARIGTQATKGVTSLNQLPAALLQAGLAGQRGHGRAPHRTLQPAGGGPVSTLEAPPDHGSALLQASGTAGPVGSCASSQWARSSPSPFTLYSSPLEFTAPAPPATISMSCPGGCRIGDGSLEPAGSRDLPLLASLLCT